MKASSTESSTPASTSFSTSDSQGETYRSETVERAPDAVGKFLSSAAAACGSVSAFAGAGRVEGAWESAANNRVVHSMHATVRTHLESKRAFIWHLWITDPYRKLRFK